VRIHITGAAGSGCTTLGRALGERLGCPHLDTDTYWWLPTDPPFQTMRSREERLALLTADLEPLNAWTLSGSLAGWGDALIPRFTLVVFLWLPPEDRLTRLAAREREAFGEAALAPGGPMHETHTRFMAWAATYDTADASSRSLQRHERWLADLPCPVLRLEGMGTVAEHVEAVVRRLSTG
jgi:adenylate kinase family enzyme